MTLTAAALKIHAATQSGILENAPLCELNALLTKDVQASELSFVRNILDDALRAAYSHRCQIVRTLQQLERSSLYIGSSPGVQASWEMSGLIFAARQMFAISCFLQITHSKLT